MEYRYRLATEEEAPEVVDPVMFFKTNGRMKPTPPRRASFTENITNGFKKATIRLNVVNAYGLDEGSPVIVKPSYSEYMTETKKNLTRKVEETFSAHMHETQLSFPIWVFTCQPSHDMMPGGVPTDWNLSAAIFVSTDPTWTFKLGSDTNNWAIRIEKNQPIYFIDSYRKNGHVAAVICLASFTVTNSYKLIKGRDNVTPGSVFDTSERSSIQYECKNCTLYKGDWKSACPSVLTQPQSSDSPLPDGMESCG